MTNLRAAIETQAQKLRLLRDKHEEIWYKSNKTEAEKEEKDALYTRAFILFESMSHDIKCLTNGLDPGKTTIEGADKNLFERNILHHVWAYKDKLRRERKLANDIRFNSYFGLD